MKKILLLVLLFVAVVLPQKKGHIFAIGGGPRPAYMMNRYIELCGGKDAKIVVLPMASEEIIPSGMEHVEQFHELGCTNVELMIFDKNTADDDSNFAKLEGVTGVFFGGGDQSKLTAVLLGTKLFERIKEIYNNGGCIGGTSAGAAVMSEVMITGNELVNKDTTTIFWTIDKGNVEYKQGFGFIKSAIIDQHFIRRKRHNRLISMVLEHPHLRGVAIDESTAIIYTKDDTFEVIGESQVLIYDATKAKNIKTKTDGRFSFENIVLHALVNGQKYDLKKGKVIK